MIEKITASRQRIGAKLRCMLDESREDVARRARYRSWIYCPGKGSGGDRAADDPTVYVAVTVAFEPGSQSPDRPLGKRLAASQEWIRARLGPRYVAPRCERNRVRTLLRKDDVDDIASAEGVRFVGVSDPIYAVGTLPVSAIVREPSSIPPRRPAVVAKIAAAIDSTKVVVGLIDVEGFDFTHPAFLDADGKTRFARIWDQNASAPAGTPGPPSEHGDKYPEWTDLVYGHDFTRGYLDDAIARAGPVAYWAAGLPMTKLASHGSHVASIAAGRGFGLCPGAVLAGVVFASSDRADGNTISNSNHGDGERLRHAVTYLQKIASELALPLVINISLGRHCGAHDGSSRLAREIDALTAGEGCCVVVAAGNSGDSRAESVSEGRIHAGREVRADTPETLVWQVESKDSTDNEMEIWYSERDRLEVAVTSPSGDRHGPVAIDQDATHVFAADGGTRLHVVHKSYDPENGCNYAFIQLSPPADGATVANGEWKIELALDMKHGPGPCKFDAWIERDDGSAGTDRHFQSYFKAANPAKDDHTKVNSLACGHNVIAVANWDSDTGAVSPSSSQGPTRDGRFKPDIAAPGTHRWGVYGFPVQVGGGVDLEDLPETGLYVRMSGTSMAAPYVAGVAALMLSVNPLLTASQIRAIMTSTARPRADWQRDIGYGLIHERSCIEEAGRVP
jgi:subtilisin family serine protease